ncbi:unnamed protein product, partial [Rhizoctonia solani]
FSANKIAYTMPFNHSMPALDAGAEAEAKWLTEVLLDRRHPDCDNFRKLEKTLSYMRAAAVVPRFRSPSMTLELVAKRKNVMYELLKAMNQNLGHPNWFSHLTSRFLDVGSKYHGFSQYILEHSNGRGVGVSLPIDDGGTSWAMLPGNRYEQYPVDLLNLVSSYVSSDPTSRPLLSPFDTEFDFVILNANSPCPRVLLAQLLLALYTIYNGGQILLTLSCIERPLTARVVIAISKIADYITTSKPPRVHAQSGLFYLHAQTVRNDTPAYRKLKDNLERLWYRIHSTHTRDPTWDEQDLITPWDQEIPYGKPSLPLFIELLTSLIDWM